MLEFELYYTWDLVIRLILATIFGGILGIEREINGKPAGFRTHLLVSLGSCGFTILSYIISESNPNAKTDPARIAAQIVTGIGFLGAGAIIKEGSNVRGLTTAACLWICACIGMTTGAGIYIGAALMTFISTITLFILPCFENLLIKHTYKTLEIKTTNLQTDIQNVINVIESVNDGNTCLQKSYITVLNFDLNTDYTTNQLRIKLLIRLFQNDGRKEILNFNAIRNAVLSTQLSITELSWSSQ